MNIDLNRRLLLQMTAGLTATAALTPAKAATVGTAADIPKPPASAREARLLWARLFGDLSGRTVFYFTHGTVWGFKPQADDLTVEAFARRIYGYSGIAVRKMMRQADGTILMRQKFWSFYRDPESDRITDKIPNPYTGVVDTAPPLTAPERTMPLDLGPGQGGKMPFDMRVRRIGAKSFIETSSFSRINPGGINWYKLEGNLENFTCNTSDIDNPALTHIPSVMDQNVIAEWQTWTKMHGVPGHILFKGAGVPLYELDAVPQDQRDAIERFFPDALKAIRGWD